MKKIKLTTSKLKLTKEKISRLTKFEMKDVLGGGAFPDQNTPTPTPTPSSVTCISGCDTCTSTVGDCPPTLICAF